MGFEIGYHEWRISNHRLEEIARDPSTLTVRYPGHSISRTPMQSRGYANCCAVVLTAPGIMGLSHYETINWRPKEYLPALVYELRENDADVKSAVLIGGDPGHLAMSKEILATFGIPVTNEYCDKWLDKYTIFPPSGASHKHVVAIPETGEVLMYSRTADYLQLA
jgi:hypothetical protein